MKTDQEMADYIKEHPKTLLYKARCQLSKMVRGVIEKKHVCHDCFNSIRIAEDFSANEIKTIKKYLSKDWPIGQSRHEHLEVLDLIREKKKKKRSYKKSKKLEKFKSEVKA